MAIAERRKRERNQRRNQIIDAAETLFFAKDYDNVTMDEIANEAEVNIALIYYYFKNKEALFLAVHHRIVLTLHGIYLNCSKLDTNGLTKLKEMSQRVFEFSREYPDHFHLYNYAESGRFNYKDNEDGMKSIKLGFEIWQLLFDAFNQGKEEGLIRKDLGSLEMSMYLTFLSKSILNIDPAFKLILESKGIHQDRLWEELGSFLLPALTNHSLSEIADMKNNLNKK